MKGHLKTLNFLFLVQVSTVVCSIFIICLLVSNEDEIEAAGGDICPRRGLNRVEEGKAYRQVI